VVMQVLENNGVGFVAREIPWSTVDHRVRK
jgi:hypothetical protein